MGAQLLNGTELSATLKTELKAQVADLVAKGVRPALAVILVGENPASVSYVTAKEKDCAEVGIDSRDLRLPADTPQEELLSLIRSLNEDPAVDGILVQLPLPASINEEAVLSAVSPDKDVDGFHPLNVGKMMLEQPTFLPCTPHGILVLLERSGIPVSGSKTVIVGRSNIVGKPLANLLLQRGPCTNATVTVCHTATRNLKAETCRADILVSAVGSPNLITADMVKKGAVVIDVGVNRIPDASKKSGFRLCGDVDFASVVKKAAYLTPVPGGVGPMTRVMLLDNIVRSASRRLKLTTGGGNGIQCSFGN